MEWGQIGPYSITHFFKLLCNVKSIKVVLKRGSGGLPQNFFYRNRLKKRGISRDF